MITDPSASEDTVPGDGDRVAALGADPADPAAYLAGVMEEIEADVEERRRRGDLPDGLEDELDRLFLEFSPVGLHGGDERLVKMLALVDSAASFDLAPPTASQKMVGGQVKRAVAQTVGWYVNFMMGQVGSFAWAVSRTLHVVGDRVAELEEAVAALKDPVLSPAVTAAPAGPAWWAPVARSALAGASGRVLHAECGDGWLVAALVADGLDAYGVDSHLPPGSREPDVDVREDSILDHLDSVADAELGGLVLSGSVQWLDVRGRARLVELVGRRLTPGGVMVLHSCIPARWSEVAPVLADLAPGRPLQPETWGVLLAGQGLEVSGVTAGGPDASVEPLAGSGSVAEGALNALIATVNRQLLGPSEYVLVATRVR